MTTISDNVQAVAGDRRRLGRVWAVAGSAAAGAAALVTAVALSFRSAPVAEVAAAEGASDGLLGGTALGKVGDWPTFRGGDRTDISKETGLLKSWPAGGPKQVWQFTEAGNGYGGMAVVDGVLYTLGTVGDDEVVFALDAATGAKKWSTAYGKASDGPGYSEGWGGGPRATPTVFDGRVYAVSPRGVFACVGTDGKVQWTKHLAKDFGGRPPGWGYSESPTIDGDLVLYGAGGSKGAVVALDRKTGETKWRSDAFKDGAPYASLVIAEIHGVRQLVTMTGESAAGIAAKDGALLWRFARPRKTAAIPTAIVSGNKVYTCSGYGEGSDLYEIIKDGNVFSAREVWSNKVMTNHHGGAILLDGHVYGFSDGKGWTCQKLSDGTSVWASGRNGLGKGSCTYADGRLYCFSEGKGECVLVEPSTTGWKEHGKFEMPLKSKIRHRSGAIWTHPTVAGGRLYLRDQDIILAFDIKAK